MRLFGRCTLFTPAIDCCALVTVECCRCVVTVKLGLQSCGRWDDSNPLMDPLTALRASEGIAGPDDDSHSPPVLLPPSRPPRRSRGGHTPDEIVIDEDADADRKTSEERRQKMAASEAASETVTDISKGGLSLAGSASLPSLASPPKDASFSDAALSATGPAGSW
jgi:hypothetical protein